MGACRMANQFEKVNTSKIPSTAVQSCNDFFYFELYVQACDMLRQTRNYKQIEDKESENVTT